MKYIYYNPGLGDHIVCNGLVRHISENFGEVSIFCKSNYFENLKYMYRDDKDINVISVGEDENDSENGWISDDLLIQKYILDNNLQNDLVFANLNYRLSNPKSIYTSFEGVKIFNIIGKLDCETFDKAYYKVLGIPFNIRFDKFFLERDYSIESDICKTLNPSGEKYIFTHNVDRTKVRSDLKIIENPTEYNIFNLISLIENAEEVHLMESSIKNLVNSFKMNKPKFFYHPYVREEYNNPIFISNGLNKFEIIE